MAPTLAKPSTHRRQDSRSNSASSSSIVTVQRAPSHNSKNGTWPPINGLRSQSPTETNSIATALSGRTGTISPETTRRRSSALHTRPDSGNGFREGVGNLNRWSQSTGSSKHSGTHNRQSSFSKRLSGSFGSFSGFAAQTPSPNATSSNRGRPLPQKSPTKSAEMPPPTTSPPPILPPIVTLSSLSQAVDAADSPSTVATITPATAEILSPLTYSSTEPDYFGNGWHSRSSKHNVGMKRPTPSTSSNVNIHQPLTSDQSRSPSSPGPPDSVYSPRIAARLRHASRRVSQSAYHRPRDIHSKGSGTTEGESSASDNRARFEKGLKRKAPSQKAMLSKALQKAHHAVTLDQHSNYEGAMHAYQEACALLQKVMIRSSGIEDRMKLDAVVSRSAVQKGDWKRH